MKDIITDALCVCVILGMFAALVYVEDAFSKTFSEAPQTQHEYDDDRLAWQQGAKKGLPRCAVIAKLAKDIQAVRQDSGHSYKQYYNQIEQRYADTKPRYDDQGNVLQKGRLLVVLRRQMQYIGKIVYSLNESMPPTVVSEVVNGQCSGGDNY